MKILRLFLTVSFMFILASEVLAKEPVIIDRPILWTFEREKLIREYSMEHYGKDEVLIEPKAVVVHWTASNSADGVYKYFYDEKMSDGTLNVASHFLVDKNGAIYRLTREVALNRHIIGYNWCAIGIENVGGKNGVEDLTEAQLEANIALIRYLKEKYPTIKYCFGHYQQDAARATGLFIEKVPDYYAKKIDPGKKFMYGLRKALSNELVFFDDDV